VSCMSRWFCFGILSLTMFALSSCGFHLRSASEVPPELKVIYLETPNPNSSFTSQLKNLLASVDVVVVTQKEAAPYNLKINNISFGHSNASILSISTPTAYTYNYSLNYSILTKKGHIIIPPTDISASDTIYAAPNQMLTNNNTDKRMQQQLQTEVIGELFNSITSNGVIKEVGNCQQHPHRCEFTVSS